VTTPNVAGSVSHPRKGTAMVAPPSSPLLGERYRVQHLLGPAGTAQVFQARDELLDRPVIVKLFPHPGGHGAGLERVC